MSRTRLALLTTLHLALGIAAHAAEPVKQQGWTTDTKRG